MKAFFNLFLKKKQTFDLINYVTIGTYHITIDDTTINLDIKKINDEYIFYILDQLNNKSISYIIKEFKFNNDEYKKINIAGNDQIYLTYLGMLRILSITLSAKTSILFQEWYDTNLQNKNIYSKNVIEIFNKFNFPCIYLLYIGDYRGHTNIYKFGRTDNFHRRYKELNKSYSTIFKIQILQYIDPEFLSKAEADIRKYVINYLIKIDNFNELISILDIDNLVNFYKELGKKYSNKNNYLQEQIKTLIHENEILQYQIEILKMQQSKNNINQ